MLTNIQDPGDGRVISFRLQILGAGNFRECQLGLWCSLVVAYLPNIPSSMDLMVNTLKQVNSNAF